MLKIHLYTCVITRRTTVSNVMSFYETLNNLARLGWVMLGTRNEVWLGWLG